MLRKIILVRHAQAQVEQFGHNDRERIITMNGMHEIDNVRQNLSPYVDDLQLALCSNAKRTRQTLDGFRSYLPSHLKIEHEDALYHCTAKNLSNRLQKLNDSITSVMIVGHNPGISDFMQVVISKGNPVHPMSAFPTCGVAVFTVTLEGWFAFDIVKCQLQTLIKPGFSAPQMASSF